MYACIYVCMPVFIHLLFNFYIKCIGNTFQCPFHLAFAWEASKEKKNH